MISAAADLPRDVLNTIQRSLPLVDYLRFPAVCRSWCSAAKQNPFPPKPDEFPWIYYEENDINTAVAIRFSPKNDTPPTTYRIPIPKSFQYYPIIASTYNYLVVKNSEGELFLVNPFSWTQISRLPPIENSEGDDYASSQISRLVTDGSIAVALARGRRLVYTRVGPTNCWVDLQDLLGFYCADIVPYKEGLFCAVSSYKARVSALDFSSPNVKSVDMTLNLEDDFIRIHGYGLEEKRLVNSSSGLFLVRFINDERDEPSKKIVHVYKLLDDNAHKKWVLAKSLDGCSFFVGRNQSISLSAADFPELRSDCIYFPYNFCFGNDDGYWTSWYDGVDGYDEDFKCNIIYNLGDGSWERFYCLDHQPLEDLQHAHLWIMPTLDKATSGKQGLGIKDQPKKVAGCYWKGKNTSFSDSVGKISADSSGSTKRKRSADLDTSSNPEPRTKLKKLCKQLLRQAPSQSLKLKKLKLLVEAYLGPVFTTFSSKREALSYLKQTLEGSRSFHVEGKKVSLLQGN